MSDFLFGREINLATRSFENIAGLITVESRIATYTIVVNYLPSYYLLQWSHV